jgi:hypothetical protein
VSRDVSCTDDPFDKNPIRLLTDELVESKEGVSKGFKGSFGVKIFILLEQQYKGIPITIISDEMSTVQRKEEIIDNDDNPRLRFLPEINDSNMWRYPKRNPRDTTRVTDKPGNVL